MTTVVMPQLGESVMEGTVVRWIAKPGQKVERDEPLVEIATDKANTEIPSPTTGVLVEQLAKEGAVVTVGGPLARLDEAGTAAAAGVLAAASGAGLLHAASAELRPGSGRRRPRAHHAARVQAAPLHTQRRRPGGSVRPPPAAHRRAYGL